MYIYTYIYIHVLYMHMFFVNPNLVCRNLGFSYHHTLAPQGPTGALRGSSGPTIGVLGELLLGIGIITITTFLNYCNLINSTSLTAT